jgi:hypothetical protein
MARKIVAVHGIGKTQPGWSDLLRVDLDIPQEDWIEFNYDDLMDRSFFHKVIVGAAKIYLAKTYGPEAAFIVSGAEEHINDLVSYFVMNGSRLEIQVRLKGILKENPEAIILGHSLGSVVAYETLKNFDLKAHTLFTFGSPLSKFTVKKFLRVPEKSRPNVVNWFNIWSRFDPISGPVDGLGCEKKDQFRIKNTHNLLKYVDSQKELIVQIYNENQDEGKAS